MFVALFACILFTFGHLWPGAGLTTAQRNSISGYVFDSSHRPLSNMRVELLDEAGSNIATARTDGSGSYFFRGLLSGNYQVKVVADGTGYLSQTKLVDLSNFRLGRVPQHAQEHFTLETRRPTGPSLTAGSETVFAQEVPAAARIAYEKASVKLARGRTKQGLAGLKEAIEIFPRYYLAMERLGTEYVQRREYEQGRVILTQALEVNPQGHKSLYALGIAQYNLKQNEKAIDSLKRSASLAPTSINSQLWLGIVLMKDKQFEEAETHLKRAYALGGSQVPDVHMYLAQIYSNSKRYKEAADELEMFLKEAPDARDSQQIKEAIKQLRAKAKQKSPF